MTKEALMEDLVKRSAGEVDPQGEGQAWHDVTTIEHIGNLFSLNTIVTLTIIGLSVCLFCMACICCCARHGKSKKKKHNFGIKKAGYFRDKMCPAKPPRNPPPVSNPDKGSHYLKKSPSPTGAKSPPGGSTNPMTAAEEFLQKKALMSGQQKSSTDFLTATDPMALRRSSSGGLELGLNELQNQATCNSRAMSLTGNALVNNGGPGSLGMLCCTVRYCFEKNALVVTINKCLNLPAKDSAAKSSDPYVKLQLLPEKQHKVKTRVMRRTLNPVYDEDFTFYGIQFNQIQGLTLHFVVLSFDRYSRDDVIGEVMVDLDSLDLSQSDQNPIGIAREITPRSFKLKTQGRGEILVSLCYQPAANRITAVVLKARNLPKMDLTGLSDPYVKIYLLYNDQRIAKKKTHVKKRTLNPVFNESFIFDLPHLDQEEGLNNISLEFLLLDWDRVTKNEVIGRLYLGGSNCNGSALHHWNEVITSPRRQIAEWHKLQE